MKEFGWSPLDVWAGFARRKLMRSSGDGPQSGALSLECILGCWQNFSWATLAFDVESPFCFAVDVMAFPSEPRVEAGTLCNRRGWIAPGGFVKDVGPPPPKTRAPVLGQLLCHHGGQCLSVARLPQDCFPGKSQSVPWPAEVAVGSTWKQPAGADVSSEVGLH